MQLKKMDFIVGNKIYEIIVASDVDRDGLGAELWDRDKNEMLAEIFRHDDKKMIKFCSKKINIPFELIERLIHDFDVRVGRQFQDDAHWDK